MAIEAIQGKVRSEPLNRNFSYVESKAHKAMVDASQAVELIDQKVDKQFATETFRIPTDFANIKAAVNKLSERKTKDDVIIEFLLESGYQIAEPIHLKNGDYGRFRITSEDSRVPLAVTFPKETFMVLENCKAPVLATIIDGQGRCSTGIQVNKGGQLSVDPGCGFINAGSTNLHVRGGGIAYVDGGVFTGASQDGDSESGGAGITAWGGFVSAEGADVSYSLTYGAQAAQGGTLCFREGIANNCGRHGIRGTNAGTVDARNAQAKNAGVHGVYSLSGSVVNAYGCSAINAGTNGLYASQNSRIVARECDVSGSGTGVFAERGSSIDFYLGIANDCVEKGIQALSGSDINGSMCEVLRTKKDVTGHGVSVDNGSSVVLFGATVQNSKAKDLYVNGGSTISAIRCKTTNSTTLRPIEGDTNVTQFNVPESHFGIIWGAG